MGNSNARQDLDSAVKHMHRLPFLSSIGISHRHLLSIHYFINYYEVFSTRIGTQIMYKDNNNNNNNVFFY